MCTRLMDSLGFVFVLYKLQRNCLANGYHDNVNIKLCNESYNKYSVSNEAPHHYISPKIPYSSSKLKENAIIMSYKEVRGKWLYTELVPISNIYQICANGFLSDLFEYLKILGYPKPLKLTALYTNQGSLENFKLIFDILRWLIDQYEPGTILLGSTDTEIDRVLLVRSAVEFLVVKAGIKLNPIRCLNSRIFISHCNFVLIGCNFDSKIICEFYGSCSRTVESCQFNYEEANGSNTRHRCNK